MSAPRSNRVDASVFKPRRLLVRLTEAGLKYALSSAIVLVASVTSEAAPPITRAIAVGDHEHVGVQLARDVVERRDRLTRPRTPDADLGPRQTPEIERVHRL